MIEIFLTGNKDLKTEKTKEKKEDSKIERK